MIIRMQIFTFLFSLLFVSFCNAQSGLVSNTTFQVGVILDSDSRVGRIGLTSLSLALSDFYSLNGNYSTRLVLHSRDSRGQVTDAAAGALNLLKDVEVDAIIGPQNSAQANFIIGLGDTAKVPIISFSATSPSLHHQQTPYFLQTAISDVAQVRSIAAIVKYFKWSQVVFVYEDTEFGNGIIPYLYDAFQHVNARVSNRSVIPLSEKVDDIIHDLKTMQTRVFVVHISSSLAKTFFLKVKEAEMMNKGYVWIVTSGLMDSFYSMDSNVVESMQGVLGVKPLIPRTRKLKSTTRRWNKKFLADNPGISLPPDISLFGLWAYDTLWALAMAAEKVGFKEQSSQLNVTNLNSTDIFATNVSKTGPKLLEAMLQTTFQGLSGNFSLVNEELKPSSFQILNVVGNRTKEVGIWTPTTQNSRERNVSFSGKNLKSVIWPGGSKDVPKGWEIPVRGGKLRIGVPEKAGFDEFVNVKGNPQIHNGYDGYYIKLFNAVMQALLYNVSYDYFPFKKSDGSNAGSYNDLSYQVYKGNFDAAVGDITITANRSKYVDFTLPIEAGGITRIQSMKFNTTKDHFFLEPFHKELWLTAIGLFFFTGVALWILEHRLNRAFRGPPSEHAGLIFYIPFMSLVFSNREKIVSNLARLVMVVWVFVVFVLYSTYTASLSAQFTAHQLAETTTDIKTLINNADHVGCREGSFIFDYLINLGFSRTRILQYQNPVDFEVALNKGSAEGGITAFFASTPYAILFLKKYCKKCKTVGSPFLTEGLAFVFPKGSPLVVDVNRAIINLTEKGTISDIRRDSLGDLKHIKETPYQPTGLSSFEIPFGVAAGVTATCLVVFLITYFYKNRDFIQRISGSGVTTWSKIRAISKHFDQRDPKSFRSSKDREDHGENASPDRNVYPVPAHRSAVVPVSIDDAKDEDGETSPNAEQVTASTDQPRSSIQLQDIRVV